jgi:hypothetical protein
MSDLKVYNADEVIVSFNGILIGKGAADGDFVSIEFDEDAFALAVGSQGEAARSRSNNRSATITITLMQTADENTLLNAMHVLDLTSPGGAGIGPLLVQDRNGQSLHFAEKAWIQKAPAAAFGREAGTREWVLRTGEMLPGVGGNF